MEVRKALKEEKFHKAPIKLMKESKDDSIQIKAFQMDTSFTAEEIFPAMNGYFNTCGHDGIIRTIDIKQGKIIACSEVISYLTTNAGRQYSKLLALPNGFTLLYSSADKPVMIFNSKTLELIGTMHYRFDDIQFLAPNLIIGTNYQSKSSFVFEIDSLTSYTYLTRIQITAASFWGVLDDLIVKASDAGIVVKKFVNNILTEIGKFSFSGFGLFHNVVGLKIFPEEKLIAVSTSNLRYQQDKIIVIDLSSPSPKVMREFRKIHTLHKLQNNIFYVSEPGDCSHGIELPGATLVWDSKEDELRSVSPISYQSGSAALSGGIYAFLKAHQHSIFTIEAVILQPQRKLAGEVKQESSLIKNSLLKKEAETFNTKTPLLAKPATDYKSTLLKT